MELVENKLKNLILSKYKSIREFSILIKIPYSTIDSIFKRGVANASVTNIIKICNALCISADMLAQGEISFIADNNDGYSTEEQKIIDNYRSLNTEGQEKVVEYIDDLVTSGKYIKNNTYSVDNKEQA